jgi:amino acid transporter
MFLINYLKNIKLPNISKLLNISEVYGVVVAVLVLYITYSSVSPNKYAVDLVSNDVGRLILLSLIMYISTIKIELGALMTFAYLVTLYNDKNINDEDRPE